MLVDHLQALLQPRVPHPANTAFKQFLWRRQLSSRLYPMFLVIVVVKFTSRYTPYCGVLSGVPVTEYLLSLPLLWPNNPTSVIAFPDALRLARLTAPGAKAVATQTDRVHSNTNFTSDSVSYFFVE